MNLSAANVDLLLPVEGPCISSAMDMDKVWKKGSKMSASGLAYFLRSRSWRIVLLKVAYYAT